MLSEGNDVVKLGKQARIQRFRAKTKGHSLVIYRNA